MESNIVHFLTKGFARDVEFRLHLSGTEKSYVFECLSSAISRNGNLKFSINPFIHYYCFFFGRNFHRHDLGSNRKFLKLGMRLKRGKLHHLYCSKINNVTHITFLRRMM